MNWITDKIASFMENFLSFKKTILEYLNILRISNKKTKILPLKQQKKWCKNLSLPLGAFVWKKANKSNHFLSFKSKLWSFQIRLSIRSIVANIQLSMN